MCCFSGPVQQVANTRIFARHSDKGTQFLVYSMTYAARQPVAMLLPLPTVALMEGALRFISLKDYPTFFADMERGFPRPAAEGIGAGSFGRATKSALAVQEVGDFVASFVPSLADFRRLDDRFRLPRRTWDKLPAYRTYGFAVFQLKDAPRSRSVHPMALEFATAMPGTLFFPTVHIHDGQVHAREAFDHALYLQAARPKTRGGMATSVAKAGTFLDIGKGKGIIDETKPCHKITLRGLLPNQDTWIVGNG